MRAHVPSRGVEQGGHPGAERRLVARLVAGDDSALARIYDQYAPLVFGVAVNLVGDDASARDVCQDVFVSLWQRPERFDPDRAPLRTWLAVLARRRAIDLLRQRGRRQQREQRVAVAAATVAPPDIEEAAGALLEGEELRRGLADLPPEQREAIELAFLHGLTHREVAARLGIPEGTVKSRVRLGLGRLARILRPEGAPA
jgi:RNA polymerase sigma-70 factor (ECF subfamily)